MFSADASDSVLIYIRLLVFGPFTALDFGLLPWVGAASGQALRPLVNWQVASEILARFFFRRFRAQVRRPSSFYLLNAC